MVFDFDDFGANHIISEQCQSHDCRDKLDQLHYANDQFKVTLFAIPGEMTPELAAWTKANAAWVELAMHGIFHTSNYECEDMSYEEFDEYIARLQPMIDTYFTKGFKAPGWQISDGIYKWLLDHGWWVADQHYNNERRPLNLPAYINTNGEFSAHKPLPSDNPEQIVWEDTGIIPAWHGHTWDCVGNGIYETFDHVMQLVKNAEEFKFVSEVLR